MNIVTKKISELKPYENNPKIHTKKQIEQIAKSKAAGNTEQKARFTRARQRQNGKGELLERLRIGGNRTKGGDAVLDLFSGSGTTIMACEQNGRRAYAMELDPRYVDATINRWENFTGKKAVLLNE